KSGDRDRAVQELRRALTSDDDQVKSAARYDMGTTLAQPGDHDAEAMQELKQALRLNPADSDAKHNLEVLLLKQQREEQQRRQQKQQQNQQQNQQNQDPQQSPGGQPQQPGGGQQPSQPQQQPGDGGAGRPQQGPTSSPPPPDLSQALRDAGS